MRQLTLVFSLAALVVLAATAAATPDEAAADTAGEALIERANQQLAALGLAVRVGEIEYFTIGRGRPANRILKQPFRWVAGDPRRGAAGNDLTYLVDASDGATASGVSAAASEAAIDSAMATWDSTKALAKLNLLKVADPGVDPDVFDGLILGDPSMIGLPSADITHAGFVPAALFDALVPGGSQFILAVSVTFIFIDTATGLPTDVNNDQHLDTAINEVYFNDNFGDPAGTRPGNPWGVNVALPGVDVETVALHESGHSLGVGHFGPPPSAVMNPVYAGIQHSPAPTDLAAMSSIFRRWPR